MGSVGEGGGSEAAAVRKPRKRQLVMESSDSEADEYCISTRQNAGAASVGNAGASSHGDGDQPEEKVVSVSSGKVSGAKFNDGDGSEMDKGGELESSSQPDSKRIRVDAIHGGGGGVGSSGSVSKGRTGGKMLPRGFPTWRLERPEVRAGWVLDEEDGVEMKVISGSKVKKQVSGLGDKRRPVELQKHEKRTPLRTDQGKSVDSGRQEVIRLQGKRGVLRILPKNDEMIKDTGDGKILLKNAKVNGEAGDGKIPLTNTKADEKTGDGRIPTKRGVLKLLPNNKSVVTATNDGNTLPKNIKVDGETGDDRILLKNTKVEKETNDGKILTDKTKLDGEFDGDKMLTEISTVDSETVAGKFLPRNSNMDEGTSGSYKGYEKKSGALAEFQKQDANGEKKVMGKLVSPIMLRKSDPSVVGVSLGQGTKQQKSKQQLKISALNKHQPSLSWKDEKTKSTEHKSLKKRLLEHKGLPENLSKKAKSEAIDLQGTSDPALKKHGMKMTRGGPRNKLKQDLRNQIKRMLLDNGWTIDLRRRKNKDYEDSVYVSPQGTGYWSITKAYAVFQEQFQNPHDEKHMSPSSKLKNIKSGVSNSISKDDLAMLKKNIVKRRTKEEIDGAEKKSGGSRSRNSKDILAVRSSRNKHQNKEDRVNIMHRGCGLLVRGSTHNTEDNMDGYVPYQWKRTVYSWMIDLGVVSEDMKIKYMNNKEARAMLEGKIAREGISCGCCSKILTVAKFELHAGSKEKQPYENIFLEDGRSLLQCLLDAWEKHTRYEKKGYYNIIDPADPGDDPYDDTCAICGDGGDLLCCDCCASTFHLICLGIKMPPGDWYCRSCSCRFCGSAQKETSSFPELLSCLQCSRKYHQTCGPGAERDSVCTKLSTSIDCFCSPGCRKIYKRLEKLLGVKNNMEAGFSWSLVRCSADSQAIAPDMKAQSVYCNSKTALAFSVIDECFRPHIDERSGINMIHNVVYNCGSDFSRLDFNGFYTFILERGDEVVSAASVRVHGTDLAEMPFIGTRVMYRHQGMCRRLLDAIESALCSLNVRKLVIPAVPEMEKTWTNVFGFKPVESSKKQKFKLVNLLIINGTGLLEKRLLPTGTINGQTTARPANAVGSDKTGAQIFGEASGSVTPVHVSREIDVADDVETRYHENSRPSIGSSAGEENEVKRTLERTSPVSTGDVKSHTLPGVDCGDNMQFKAVTDNIQEGKYKETNGKLIAENTVAEQKCEDISNSRHAHSLATPVTLDPRSLSNGMGKGENRPSNKPLVEAIPITNKTESDLRSNSPSVCANQGDEKSCAAPFDTIIPSVTMDEKPGNHKLQIMVADGYIPISTKVKGLEDITNVVNGTSIGTYRDEDTSEDHSASAVDCGVFMKESVQQTEVTEDKIFSPSADLKPSSIGKDMLERLYESKSIESDKIEMNDTTIKVGMTVESPNNAGITEPRLDISNDVCGEVMAKHTQTCGEGQLHGGDVTCSNSMEDDLASREPVNA